MSVENQILHHSPQTLPTTPKIYTEMQVHTHTSSLAFSMRKKKNHTGSIQKNKKKFSEGRGDFEGLTIVSETGGEIIAEMTCGKKTEQGCLRPGLEQFGKMLACRRKDP